MKVGGEWKNRLNDNGKRENVCIDSRRKDTKGKHNRGAQGKAKYSERKQNQSVVPPRWGAENEDALVLLQFTWYWKRRLGVLSSVLSTADKL